MQASSSAIRTASEPASRPISGQTEPVAGAAVSVSNNQNAGALVAYEATAAPRAHPYVDVAVGQ